MGPIGTDGTIVPGRHTPLGEYLSLEISWLGLECSVQAARVDADYVVIVTPLKKPVYPPTLIVESGFLWGFPGLLSKRGTCLEGIADAVTHKVYALGTERVEKNAHCHGPHMTISLQEAVSISTGVSRSSEQTQTALAEAQSRTQAGHFADPVSRDLSEAIESVITWNTIYEPSKGRIVTPVSRRWSAEDHGGYMLFVWDTFFASVLASVHSKELAYANAHAIVSERLAEGYLPAMACNLFNRGKDRSPPPVGSLCVSLIAHHFKDNTLISELFNELHGWNTWYDTGQLSYSLSPTLFYPLLTNAVSPERAARMMKDHFYNPQEFWCDWILPSIARNDPAFADQDYWRGPVWAPMNFLVYLGLSKAGLTDARADLAAKSTGILLKEYRSHGHIHENWNSKNGDGCPSGNSRNKSDPFYTWGALMALIGLIQDGSFDLSPDFSPPSTSHKKTD